MKKTGFWSCLAAAGLILFTVASASAQDDMAGDQATEETPVRGFYVGGSFGGSFFSDAPSGIDSSFTLGSTDDKDINWSGFVGYRMADWWAFEVAYRDMGTIAVDGTSSLSSNVKADISTTGYETRIKVWHDLGLDWLQGIGGIGLYFFDMDADVGCSSGSDSAACTGAADFLEPNNDSGEALTISAGLAAVVNDHIQVRTEWERFFDVGGTDVNAVSVSVIYGFWNYFGQGLGGGDDMMGGIVVE